MNPGIEKNIRLIYLLGHSRSGSTILSFHLGRFDQIFYAGEIKKYSKVIFDRVCTCNKKPENCIFWKDVILDNKEYFKKDARSDLGFYRLIQLFRVKLFGPSRKTIVQESKFLTYFNTYIQNTSPNKKFILDSSKSLQRLILLESIENIDLKIIFLKRNLRANLASFIKRKKSLLTSYFRLRVNDFLMERHLKRKSLNFIKLSYEDFIQNPESILEQIAEFIEIEKGNMKTIKPEELHVISGNRRTRKAIREGAFKIRKNENQEDPFSRSQKLLMKVLGI